MSAFQIALNLPYLDTNKQENTHKSSNSMTEEVPKIALDKCFCFICPIHSTVSCIIVFSVCVFFGPWTVFRIWDFTISSSGMYV